ncbi:VWA domain-containing protein [Vibrio europaeus]|uniref:Tad domain-containing protein n=1 Tax=Vibrio europaeus TaxID=300876 RepID=UPI0018A78540|nr:Tad domain-containing protein [Vibrio europaeus]MDC5811944.1 VWA domain-containing protein [Vibrio europaeus]QPG33395.1 VWA domain-containing protein [Vibrio europaeus]
MNTSKYQQGAATIWYIFLIGAIMSLGALAIEGSRYIGKKARLGDALEAGSIAVASNDRVTKDFDSQTSMPSGYTAEETAETWIKHYLADDRDLSIDKIDRIETSKTYGIDTLATPYKVEHFRYDIEATSTHDSWFRFSDWARFNDEVKVANTGAAGRVKGGHEPVDIVFVADYSGSMDKCLYKGKEISCRKVPKGGDRTNKITYLKRAITGVTERIYNAHSESTFGFIPFTKRIVTERNGTYYCASPLHAGNKWAQKVREKDVITKVLKCGSQKERDELYVKLSDKEPIFNDPQAKALANYYATLMKGRVWGRNRNWQANDAYKEYVKATYKPWRDIRYSWRYPPSDQKGGAYKFDRNSGDKLLKHPSLLEDQISIWSSANKISIENKPMFPMSIAYGESYRGGSPRISRYCTSSNNGVPNFYSIERKSMKGKKDVERFNKAVNKMKAGGGTDMYQGLLAAPHQFYGATNPNRYIIVLSDGKENNNTFASLVKAGLCTNLKKELKKENGVDKYNFKLFVVGIGLDQNNNDAYKTCFEDNIITVWDPAELEKRILSIITDDIGHNFER